VDVQSVTNERWWHRAVGYEIYVRSFADSSGNGVGDLRGAIAKLDHLVDLGIDLVWLTPFYPSPMADFGYDVSDYRGVDPLFGSIDDLDELIVEARSRALRVIIDVVPNHCSSDHPWFQSARRDPAGPHRDYFIWRDPAPGGGPPNNWVSYFGGPAWTLDPASGQYYLHLFLPEQPDLNWRSPAVAREFEDILRFWLDRGIDGFRIDVAHALVKDAELRSNPEVAPWDPAGDRWAQWDAFEHLHDVRQPDSLEIFASWRRIADEYGAMLLGETYVLTAAELASLLRGDGLHTGFWFTPMHMEWDAQEIRRSLREPLVAVSDPRRIGWVASSHDEERAPTRFGGGDIGRRRALALSTLLMGLPGLPFLFQGEELGLLDGVVPVERRADPVGKSRDGCRTPMPWEPGVSFGFSTNPDPWLPHGGRNDLDTVARQRAAPESWFHRYRALVAVRRAEPDLWGAALEWIEAGPTTIAYRRGRLEVAANVGEAPTSCGVAGSVLFSSSGRSGAVDVATTLAPAEALIVRRSDP